MKKNLFISVMLAALTLSVCFVSGCKKEEGSATAVFYTISSFHGDMDVYVEGKHKGTLTKAFSGAPSCDSSTSDKVVNVSLAPGTYRWSALGEDGSIFYASFTLDADGCRLQAIP